MLIQRLQVQNVRNLRSVTLLPLRRINVFYGPNGSGKTSVLEALHLLLAGRSFRHSQIRPLISEGTRDCLVFAELMPESAEGGASGPPMALGLQRGDDGKVLIKCNGERLRSLSELVSIVPVQLLNADSFELLTGGPGGRREYLDWGLFHVEPSFFPVWQQAQRALKQRNSLIRHDKIQRSQLLVWSKEYARYGEQLDALRQGYMAQLVPLIQQLLGELNPAIAERLSFSYARGWAKDQTLEQLLVESIDRDRQQGFTRAGPHRADLRVSIGGAPAAETLSRGQLKLVVASLRMAQVGLLKQLTGKRCISLLDDLPAELDVGHRRKLCGMLEQQQLQVFVTCIDRNELADCWADQQQVQLFHVEHGRVNPV